MRARRLAAWLVIAAGTIACAGTLDDPEGHLAAYAATGGAGGGTVSPLVGRVDVGRTVFETNACNGCHGDDLAGGGLAVAPNLTPDVDHGVGAWTDDELVRVVRTGIKRDGTTCCDVMRPYPGLDAQALTDLVAYVRSVPPSTKTSEICR